MSDAVRRASYRFSAERLIEFIPEALDKTSIPRTGEGTSFAGLGRRTLSEYFGFLAAGGFITETKTGIEATDSMRRLFNALISGNLEDARECFRSVQSLKEFLDGLSNESPIQASPKAPERERPSYTYVQIAELCGCALAIPLEGIYGTFSNPSAGEFVDLAIGAYEETRKGENYVLTGLWLEALASKHGVHPVKARTLLAEAQAGGMIERYTQGSTPETRFDTHTLRVLQLEKGLPAVAKVGLYHGDFILPGKASVSIRLERRGHGA